MKQWDGLAPNYEAVSSQKRIFFPQLTTLIDPTVGSDFLDVGCGAGNYAGFYFGKGLKVMGVDSSPGQIDLARKKNPGPDYVCSFVQDLVTDRRFDTLFANMVLCNVPTEKEVGAFFSKTAELAKPNARFYLTTTSPAVCSSSRLPLAEYIFSNGSKNGAEIKVILDCDDGTRLEPFTNYYWTRDFLLDVAKSAGWSLGEEWKLRETPDKIEEYRLYRFDLV